MNKDRAMWVIAIGWIVMVIVYCDFVLAAKEDSKKTSETMEHLADEIRLRAAMTHE